MNQEGKVQLVMPRREHRALLESRVFDFPLGVKVASGYRAAWPCRWISGCCVRGAWGKGKSQELRMEGEHTLAWWQNRDRGLALGYLALEGQRQWVH